MTTAGRVGMWGRRGGDDMNGGMFDMRMNGRPVLVAVRADHNLEGWVYGLLVQCLMYTYNTVTGLGTRSSLFLGSGGGWRLPRSVTHNRPTLPYPGDRWWCDTHGFQQVMSQAPQHWLPRIFQEASHLWELLCPPERVYLLGQIMWHGSDLVLFQSISSKCHTILNTDLWRGFVPLGSQPECHSNMAVCQCSSIRQPISIACWTVS